MGGILGTGRFQNLSWSLLALVWIPMFAFLVWGRGGVLNHLTMRREVSNIESEIHTLQQENKLLHGEIHVLETDPGAYEGEARQRLFRKKPGEIILYLPAETDSSTGTSPTGDPGQDSAPYPATGEILGAPLPDEALLAVPDEHLPTKVPPNESLTPEPAIAETPSAPVPAGAASVGTPHSRAVAVQKPPIGDPAPTAPLPGDPGWLKSDPSTQGDGTPHTGNPLPGDPNTNGGSSQSTGSSGTRRSGG